MYLSANEHFKSRFGCKVYKLGVDAGFTCPNRDGTCGTGGCIFCDAHGGSAFTGQGSIAQQLEQAKALVEKKISGGKYIACAINTMPHGDQTIYNNNYDGQFCLHMVNSRTHGSNCVNASHQQAIKTAYSWAH